MKEMVICSETFLGGTCPADGDPLDRPSHLQGTVAISYSLALTLAGLGIWPKWSQASASLGPGPNVS